MSRPKKEEPTGFGISLKRIRETAGLTQEDLAVKTGLNRFSIAKLEQGHREPNWPTVIKLADALGASVEAFRECLQDEQPAKPKRTAAKKPAARKAKK